MPANDLSPLLRIGPFAGLDATTVSPYLQGGKTHTAVAANPTRRTQGIANERGRVLLNKFPARAGTYIINTIVPYIAAYNDPQILVDFNTTAGGDQMAIYDTVADTTNTVTNGAAFTQAVQFQSTIYTNGGQQYSSLNPDNAYQWQYQEPNYYVSGDSSPFNPGTQFGNCAVIGINLTTGAQALQDPTVIYYYAFSWVFKDANGAFLQETSVNGLTPRQITLRLADGIHDGSWTVLPFTIPTSIHDATPAPLGAGNNAAEIGMGDGTGFTGVGQFSGTTSDGATWTTNIYRQSSVQPAWTLVASGVTGGPGATWIDGNSDSSIAGNQSPLTHDQPPFTVGTPNFAPVCVHKDRTWVFSNVSNANTNNQEQCQLWYSDYGTPWSFDAANQVLLIGQESVTNDQLYFGQGDHAVQVASLSTILMVFKSRSTWVVYGDSEADFTPLKLFDVGCRSNRSVATSQGLVFWLSEQGIYLYDGSVPQYISEPVRFLIEGIPPSDQVNAVGMYSHNTYYLSFPATGITIAYNAPLQMWWTLPYSTNSAYSVPSNPSNVTFSGSTWLGQVVAVNQVQNTLTNTPEIDYWFGAETDLNKAITFSASTGDNDSGQPNYEKEYRFVTLLAPYQNASATVTLTVDGGVLPGNVLTFNFDLSSNPAQPMTRHILAVPSDRARGFLGNLSVACTGSSNATNPTVIYSVEVWGTMHRNLNIPSGQN